MTASTVILPPGYEPVSAPEVGVTVRGDARRAMRMRLRRTLNEMERCFGIAVEIGDAVNAARIRSGIEQWREVVGAVEGDAR